MAYKSQGRTYEPETTKVIKENVKEGDVCVDVGASIGYMTMQLARQSGKTGKVLAFEPTDNQFEYLNANIQLNAGYKNKIKGVVLDDVLPEKVDFIKMDIDGSEPRALKGLVKTFERNPQLKLIVEFYPKCQEELGNDPKEMMAILDKYFTYEKIEGDYTDTYWNYICKRK